MFLIFIDWILGSISIFQVLWQCVWARSYFQLPQGLLHSGWAPYCRWSWCCSLCKRILSDRILCFDWWFMCCIG
jgi:hypothetical protein